jgi:hypothetical protein
VPTVYETRTREASGKGTVNVTTKLYYFWFLGNTIAGVSSGMELCPGMGMTFGENVAPKQVVAGGQNQETANDVSKAGPPAVARRPVKKAGSSAAKSKSEAAK